MNRNVESRFALAPADINIARSQFDRSCSHKFSFSVGDIVPFFVEEILPGDSFNVKTSKVIRLPALLKPMMDNLYLDTYFFYCPNRILWDHWKEFLGEPSDNAWLPSIEYQIPQIYPAAIDESSTYAWTTGSVADYMGVPVGVPGLPVSALPFRAYAKICNEWFRDENLSDPLVINTGDSDVGVVTDPDAWSYSDLELPALGLALYKASKLHDLYTSALPHPQRGPDVTLPMTGNAPVFASSTLAADFSDFYDSTKNSDLSSLTFAKTSGSWPGTNQSIFINNSHQVKVYELEGGQPAPNTFITPSNLVAYLGDVNSATVNELRCAFSIQRFYEKSARSGSRYTELLRSFFGVVAPDASLQRPEYLGGNRIPITINQIIQQSMSSGDDYLGSVAAMSLTTDTHSDFVKSFSEHGWIIGVMVARYDHTYQQGLDRMFSRRDKFDFYFPVFANLGEQPVLNKEIFAQGPSVKSDGKIVDDQVFGYQEAWADYRYKPNRVSGLMRSNPFTYDATPPASLDVWHLADDYASLPYLSDSWIREDSNNVNRVLTVADSTSGFQIFADVFVRNRATRPMPLYSIPGFIDHH